MSGNFLHTDDYGNKSHLGPMVVDHFGLRLKSTKYRAFPDEGPVSQSALIWVRKERSNAVITRRMSDV